MYLGFIRLNNWNSVVEIDGRKIHWLKNSLRWCKVLLLFLCDGLSVIHVKEDCLCVIKIWIIKLSLRIMVILFLQLFIQVFNQLNFHFLVYSIQRYSFIQSFFQFFWLIFDIHVLVFNFSLDTFHVGLDVVNVLDSLVCCLVRNIGENAKYFAVFLLQIFYHLV